jgi:hypothetical protein
MGYGKKDRQENKRNMTKHNVIGLAMFLAILQAAPAQYQEWQHSGSFYILTTPEGANLPATAAEENFPLLVRLNKATFDFSQAQPTGADVRFSADGKALAYQVEQWDAANGAAAIWVRIPVIKGNARQEIKLHWGKADAASESSGSAVFNESNGFLTVMHLSDPANPVKDEAGALTPTDAGTSASPGMIGQGRRFGIGKGIKGGESITTLPTGDSPHTSEAWFKAEQSNVDILGWGNQEWQGKVVMQLVSPAHMYMDCFFSDCNVTGDSRIPMSQWIHVVNTYKRGESLIYVNGVLDGSNASGGAKAVRNNRGAPLNVKSPARMYVGGWYGNYRFVGDIDEVRISKVVRSADWVKMEYESQNPRQTMVGILVQPGSAFSVSPASVTVDEAKSVTVTAQVGGALKTYWILKRDGAESVVAVDQASYTLDARRVVGDTSLALQFKAVCANEVKTKDVPVTIKETIPEPVVTLKAPAKWNGRDTIEVLSVIGNLKAMKDKGAGELHYKWTVSGGAVTKEIAPDKLILKRSQYTGPITVTLAVNNGGATTVATAAIQVTQPESDPWVQRTPGKDEKPEDGQFYARDDKNEGTLYYNGTLSSPADSVFLKVYADDKLLKTETQKPTAEKGYAFTVKLKPGLIKYKVEFGTKTGGAETVVQTVTNLVCGDAYLIDGQSNALATDTGEKSPPDTSEWIRSYGRPGGEENGPRQNLWCYAVWKAEKGEKAELGWWGMQLAKRLVASNNIPIFIINGAGGGTRIDQHQRNESHPTDLNTIYGRILWRVQQARLTHGIRAVLWHQGENDQGSDGPTGGYGWESYQQYFLDMSAAWKQDFPNLRHYYIYQIWPNSCSMGNGHGDMLREVQRNLPRLYSNMDIMSTLGIQPPGGCHFPLIGWAEFARLIQPQIERDFYGKAPATSITAPNLKQAYYTSSAKDAIALEFDQPVVWSDALASQFYLDTVADKVAAGAVSGNVVTLKLKEASTAKKVAYLKEMNWSQDKLLVGANGIAALSFCDVPISAGKK